MKRLTSANFFIFTSILAASANVAAASTVEVYGILDTSLTYAKGDQKKLSLMSGNYLPSRIGFRGSEDLGSGLKAKFALESGISSDSGAGATSNANNQPSGAGSGAGMTFNRQSWLGIEGQLGEVRLGRDFNPSYRLFIVYDPFMGGGPGGSLGAMSSISAFGYSPAGIRHSNSIQYISPGKLPLSAQVMYAMGENAVGKNGDYYSGIVTYKNKDINFSASYGKIYDDGVKNIEEYGVGFKYLLSSSCITALYTQTSNGLGVKQEALMLGYSYVYQQTNYVAAYSKSKRKNQYHQNIGESDKISLMANYSFSKRTGTYVMLAHVDNKNGASSVPFGTIDAKKDVNASSISVGIVHKF